MLYCPYKSGYYKVRELKSPSCFTILCNQVGTGEVIKYKREGLTKQQTLVIRHWNERNVFSFHSRALSLVGSQRCVFLSYHSTTVQGTSLVSWLTVDTAVLPRSHVALMQARSQLTIQLATYSENMQRAVQLLVQANAQVFLQSGYSLREVLQSFIKKKEGKRALNYSSQVSALEQQRCHKPPT